MEKEAGQVKKILAQLGRGEYIGEIAALIEAPRTASVVTVQDSRIAVINEGTFRNLLRESDQIALFMLKEFSRRIRHTNEALDDRHDPILDPPGRPPLLFYGMASARRL